jgi:hypothetical protein
MRRSRLSASRGAIVPVAAMALHIGACGRDLLPEELVLPGDIPSRVWEGTAGSAFGASVALLHEDLLVGSPGTGEVLREASGASSQGPQGLGEWAWWDDDEPRAGRAGDGVYAIDEADATLLWATPGAISFAAGSDGTGPFDVVCYADRLAILREGIVEKNFSVEGIRRAAAGDGRVLLVTCPERSECLARALDLESGSVSDLGTAGGRGAIREIEGIAWWGDPDDREDDGAGVVRSEAGDVITGLPGDHLGTALSMGHASGVFNKWLVPARARVVPLRNGPVLAVDRGTEDRPLTLSEDDERLAIGVPSFGRVQSQTGRVFVVQASALSAGESN